jgi:hypothetical protein
VSIDSFRTSDNDLNGNIFKGLGKVSRAGLAAAQDRHATEQVVALLQDDYAIGWVSIGTMHVLVLVAMYCAGLNLYGMGSVQDTS